MKKKTYEPQIGDICEIKSLDWMGNYSPQLMIICDTPVISDGYWPFVFEHKVNGDEFDWSYIQPKHLRLLYRP